MKSDGYIDDEKLALLLNMVSKIVNDRYSLKSVTTDSKDIQEISIILNTLEEEQKKIKKNAKWYRKNWKNNTIKYNLRSYVDEQKY